VNPTLLRARINASLEKKRLRDREVEYRLAIERERKRADDLLHVILPGEIVRELKETNTVRPRRCDEVAVLFADIVGFTPYCESHPPEDVLERLQLLIEAWEAIAQRHQVEKIKTIGDAFMAACGLLEPVENPVRQCLHCAREMIASIRQLVPEWNVRIGINVGPVVAGVLGKRQYLFDLWGDTVNTAARLESHGVAGGVTLSAAAWQRVADQCEGTPLGEVQLKGKGAMQVMRFDRFRED
jgi:class 3 adenylate cyclase